MAFATAKSDGIRILLPAALILLLDQLSKLWALNALDNQRHTDLFWTLRLNLTRNSGTIFGLGGNFGSWFALIGVVVLVLLLFLGFSQHPILRGKTPGYLIGISLMAGGAMGNLGDRLFRSGEGFADGSVVDFIDLQWWPVFNIADAAITIGMVLIAWHSFRMAFVEELQTEESQNPQKEA